MCRLIHEPDLCPGGILYETDHWVVQHSTGPLPVGTLIVKPRRHCVHLADLHAHESSELGPLLQLIASVVQTLSQADQTYVSLWSHRDWIPGHIHFVVQPAWTSQSERFSQPGARLQAEMFEAGDYPDTEEIVAFCDKVQRRLGTATDDEAVVH
jgi:diadenosine tetraphosphate (Ap4A) HIT family hydrolase